MSEKSQEEQWTICLIVRDLPSSSPCPLPPLSHSLPSATDCKSGVPFAPHSWAKMSIIETKLYQCGQFVISLKAEVKS